MSPFLFAIYFNTQHDSYCQNNVPFPPPDNFLQVGKNSQIKARKREQGHGFLEYSGIDWFYSLIRNTLRVFSLTRSNLLRQLPDLKEIIRRLTVNCCRKRFNRNKFMTFAIYPTRSIRIRVNPKNYLYDFIVMANQNNLSVKHFSLPLSIRWFWYRAAFQALTFSRNFLDYEMNFTELVNIIHKVLWWQYCRTR